MSYKNINLAAGVEMRVDIAGVLILVDSVSTGQGVDIATVRNGTASAYIPGRQAGFRMVGEYDGVLLKSALDCVVGIFLSMNDVQLGGTAGGSVAVPAGVSITNDLAHSIPVTLTSSSDTTPIPVSLAAIKISNTPAEAIPVQFTGTVAPVLGNVAVTNTDAQAVPVVQKAGVVFETHVGNTDAQAVPVVQKVGTVFTTHIDNLDAAAVPVQQKAGTVFTVQRQALAALVDMAPVAVGIAAAALVSDATLKRLVVRNTHATAIVAIGGAGVTLANGARQLMPGDSWTENDAAGAAWYAISDTAATMVQIAGAK